MLRGVQCYTQSCSPYLKRGYLYTIKIKVTKTPIIISEYYTACSEYTDYFEKTQLLLNRETGSHKVCCSLSLHTVLYERNPRWFKQLIICATHGGGLMLLLLLCVFCWKDFREGWPLPSIEKQDYLKHSQKGKRMRLSLFSRKKSEKLTMYTSILGSCQVFLWKNPKQVLLDLTLSWSLNFQLWKVWPC